jgi:acyl carrier protein
MPGAHVTVSPVRDAPSAFDDDPGSERDASRVDGHGSLNRRAAISSPAPASRHVRPSLDTPFVEPVTSTEREVAGIWAELLGIDRVGLDDHFIELGGDSLLATQIVARVRTRFQVELSLRDVMDQPTVRRMAAGIATRLLGAHESVRELVLSLDGMSDEEAAARLLALQQDPSFQV